MTTKLMADFLTEDQLAKELGRKVRALQYWRRWRKGPPWIKYGQTIIYKRDSVLKWLASQEVQPVRERAR